MDNNMQFGSKLEKLSRLAGAYPEGGSLSRYIDYLNEELIAADPLFKEKYQPIIREEEEALAASGEARPFLSAVVRTQGRRPDMLRETLLTLQGQTDEDLEIIMVAHKPGGEGLALIRQIIDEFPESFRKKIRLFELNEGGRTTPLNFGFAHARGEYIAITDDDDIVLDNWIEVFRQEAEKAPGHVIKAGVLFQDWKVLSSGKDHQELCSVGKLKHTYCGEYEWFEQLRENSCPPIGLAFPGYAFRTLGIIFDESLTTTEDWDMLLRTVHVMGISSVSEPTSVYRHFINSENSSSAQKKAEWDANYQYILNKINRQPMIIPAGFEKSVSRESAKAADHGIWSNRLPALDLSVLYLNKGGGYSEEEKAYAGNIMHDIFFESVFDLPEEMGRGLTGVRFDICEDGMFGIEEFVFMIFYTDGTTESGGFAETAENNGIPYNGKASQGLWFRTKDPQIEILTDASKTVDRIRIAGAVIPDLPEEFDIVKRS